MQLMAAARPVSEVMADAATEPALRELLARSMEIRRFASQELGLPENRSYTDYADLKRPFAVWNVVAAPTLSLKLHQWCFPVAGCVSYRGFFNKDAAEAFARKMRDEGLEAFVGGVPAYSTLGWFSDPLLNTFVGGSETEIARLVFHELAHQRLYISGDSTFNESYATAVERAGVERWLQRREAQGADTAMRQAWLQRSQRRTDFLALLARHRSAMEEVFRSDRPDAEKRTARDAIFESMRADFELLKQHWGGDFGYARWFGQPLTTAHLAAVATYAALVPAFEALLAREAGNFERFHAEAARIGAMDRGARRQALAAIERDFNEARAARVGAPAVEPNVKMTDTTDTRS